MLPPNLTQIAKAIGVDQRLVSRYAKRGMPVDTPIRAQAWMRENIRPRTKPGAKAETPPAPPAPPPPAPVIDGYHGARVSREQAEARLSNLRALEAEGILVNRERVRREVAQKLAGLRDSLLQIPARLQSVVAAETDETKCHDLMADELMHILEQFIEVV